MNDSWRYKAVGITKYNPIYYDENGVYTKDEWTSISDVGKTYDGHIFTIREYLETEKKYIEAVKIIMQLNKCEYMNIRYLHKNDYKKGIVVEEDEELDKEYIKIVDKQKINYNDIAVVIKLILREAIWCDLINLSKRLYIRFGYDYYMYFNTKIKKELYQDKIEELGLFVS
jgi:hypothetical protein